MKKKLKFSDMKEINRVYILNQSQIIAVLNSDHMTIPDRSSMRKGDMVKAKTQSINDIESGKCYILKIGDKIIIRYIKNEDDYYYLYCLNPEYAEKNITVLKEDFSEIFSEVYLCTSYERDVN